MAVMRVKMKHARLPLGLPRAVRLRGASEFAAIRMRAMRPAQRAPAAAPPTPAPTPGAAVTER